MNDTPTATPRKLWEYKRPYGKSIDGIAGIVRDRMIAIGENPNSVAEACGIDYSLVYRFVTGRSNISVRSLATILEHLGLQIAPKR